MHTIDLLEQALSLAASRGLRVRQEWLGGSGGGRCEIRGVRWLFVDLALTPAEQFAQVAEALVSEPGGTGQPVADAVVSIPISTELYRALELRKSA